MINAIDALTVQQGNTVSIEEQTSLDSRVSSESRKSFSFMSTRLGCEIFFYPILKAMGKDGVGYRCDWLVYDDFLFNHVKNAPPKTIFLHYKTSRGLKHFVEKLLPTLKNSFVLVVAGSDATFPLGNKDDRHPDMQSPRNQAYYKTLMENPYLKACFVENLDKKGKKLHPLPLGLLHKDEAIEAVKDVDFSQKELKAICIHRIHEGSSWNERLKVNDLCNKHWKDFIYQKESCSREEFLKTMQTYPFCLCVHGGGIDPSPKAWEALAMGCIPIIEHSTLDEAYSQLPVVFIDKWDKQAISKEKLEKWLEKLRPFYEDPQKRAEVIKKLSLEYWWKEITSKLHEESKSS